MRMQAAVAAAVGAMALGGCAIPLGTGSWGTADCPPMSAWVAETGRCGPSWEAPPPPRLSRVADTQRGLEREQSGVKPAQGTEGKD